MSFIDDIQKAKDVPDDESKRMGGVGSGGMDEKHAEFLKTLRTLLENGTINVEDPQSLVNHEVYDSLSEEWQDKADLALGNIARQLKLIADILLAKDQPDEAPQLQTMVEQLWQTKQTIEAEHDVFVF